MILYCLDNSDAACRSEDYPCGNRLGFQLNFARTVSRAVLAPQQGQQAESTSDTAAQLALVSSAGRPQLAVAPTTNASALLSLESQLTCLDGERCQFLGSLRLALLAVKRSSAGRVLAFLASQADLPAEQCRQLSRSFAEAGVPLDLVLLCPADEVRPELLASLELLTAASVYEQPCAAVAAAAATQQPGSRRPPPSGRAAATSADPAAAARQPAAGVTSSPAAGAEARTPATAPTPRGQRLVHFPPPDPSLALWQQMEPLLEQLQLEGQIGSIEPGVAAGAAGAEDDRGLPSQLRTGRPPLPRPPRSAATASASSSSSSAPSSSSSPSLGQRAPGLAPSGPLQNRSGARGAAGGTCRYESLDSLQHLSLDGFLRSWLPSYANYSRLLQIPSTQQQQQQQSGGGGGDGGADSGGGGGGSAGLGPGRLCYISVYRLQLPRWHKLCEVHAGCMFMTDDAPEGAAESPRGSGAPLLTPTSEAASAAAPVGPTASSSSSSPSLGDAAAAPPPPPPARPAVAVPRAPCPVQVHFSTQCSSAAAAVASASSSTSDGSGGAARCRWVCADLRRGSLSLVASVEDPGLVKLLWSERQRPNAAAPPQYGSIFPTAEDSSDGGVDPAAAELEITLSPTRSQFRVVTQVKGGAVLEVFSPRSAILRPRQSAATGASSSSPQQSAAAGAAAAGSQGGAPRGAPTAAPTAAPTQPPAQHQHHQRYFFWLQQDWAPEGTSAAAATSSPSRAPVASAAAAGAAEEEEEEAEGGGAAARSAPLPLPLPDRGCRALAEYLQALLECPPEFDPHKHGSRVRCSSTPLQLGPLPFALIEEIMRASGRQLHPDGTLALTTTSSALSAAAAGAAATNASSASSAAARLRQQQGSGGGGGAGSRGELRKGPAADGAVAAAAATAVVAREPRAASAGHRGGGGGGGDGGDGRCNLSLSRSPNSAAGVAPNAAAPRRLAAGAPPAAVTTTTTPPVVGPAAPVARGTAGCGGSASRDQHPSARTSQASSERREIVQGFSRTTYSRPPAAPAAAAATASSSSAAAAVTAAGGQGLAGDTRRMEAARALSSHPLLGDFGDDELEWGSDCDCPAADRAGTSAESSAAATPRRGASDTDRRVSGATAAAVEVGPSPMDADSAFSPPDSAAAVSPSSTEHATTEAAAACLPGGCARGGLAAVAAAAAAAAAVGSSGASLVAAAAAVEPEGGGSCPEDSSLMFELD